VLFADGKLHDSAQVAQAALADAELCDSRGELPGTEAQRAQLGKEFEVLRTFLKRAHRRVQHSSEGRSAANNKIAKPFREPAAKPFQEPVAIEPFTHDVQHANPAAEIPREEAAISTDEFWASGVQRLARESPVEVQPALMLVTFSRHSASLHQAILAAPLVKQLAHEGVDVQPKWGNGAFVLAPIRAEDIDMELHSRCVLVVGEDNMLSLLGALEHLPYVHRKLKPEGLLLVGGSSAYFRDDPGSSNETADAPGPSDQPDPIYYSVVECPVRNTSIDFHMPNPAAAHASRSV